VLVVSNMTPVLRTGYRVGVPRAGIWREMLNSDAGIYGGSNAGNGGSVQSRGEPANGQSSSLVLTLPPLATLYFRWQPD
jgi:1,4-alpha-glucan branching enzyme